ncbi:hypothetical protein F511_16832 [Dorcoceras hygrometricum]|uniref:Uncharacterized protein n=1 Tax=Dorcoceras hygrometricum TaxID=472368 RepID=A0A2Z7APU1_9LAMI|nr:hypothetical protein F511_16832 [Dorcoceras hygrometricum]
MMTSAVTSAISRKLQRKPAVGTGTVDGTRVKRRRFMDQQMREFRVTSCWFGKTVEEVERRRFVKLKRCVFEPAARGLWYLKFSDSKTMSFEEVDTTAFRLYAKRFSRWVVR